MRWPSQINYHGTREYVTDRPQEAAVGQFRVTVAFVADAARRKFGRLLKLLWPAQTQQIMAHDPIRFSWLASAIAEDASSRRAPACPFPEQDSSNEPAPANPPTPANER